MLKKLATALTALTLALGFSAAAVTSAQATDLPATPVITLEKATCTAKANTLKVSGFDTAEKGKYRFVLYTGDTIIKQLNTAERDSLFAGTLTAEAVGKTFIQYPGDYSLQPYYFDKGNKYKNLQSTVNLSLGSTLTKAVKLGEKVKLELVDPKSLNCDKPADPNPAPAEPTPAEPKPADPAPADPNPTEPNPAEPKPAEPTPAPAEPKPADPALKMRAAPAQQTPAAPEPLLSQASSQHLPRQTSTWFLDSVFLRTHHRTIC